VEAEARPMSRRRRRTAKRRLPLEIPLLVAIVNFISIFAREFDVNIFSSLLNQ